MTPGLAWADVKSSEPIAYSSVLYGMTVDEAIARYEGALQAAFKTPQAAGGQFFVPIVHAFNKDLKVPFDPNYYASRLEDQERVMAGLPLDGRAGLKDMKPGQRDLLRGGIRGKPVSLPMAMLLQRFASVCVDTEATLNAEIAANVLQARWPEPVRRLNWLLRLRDNGCLGGTDFKRLGAPLVDEILKGLADLRDRDRVFAVYEIMHAGFGSRLDTAAVRAVIDTQNARGSWGENVGGATDLALAGAYVLGYVIAAWDPAMPAEHAKWLFGGFLTGSKFKEGSTGDGS